MKKIWHDDAWADYLYWQTQDRKTLKRINQLLQDIERNGYSGWWSRRIDDCNRIVYRIRDGVLEIVQCGGHYCDN